MKAYIESSDSFSTREASRLRTKVLLLMLTALFIVALFAVPRAVSPVHAATPPGTVCIVPLDAVAIGSVGAPCRPGVDFTNRNAANSTGVTFAGPPPTAHNQLIVGVFINNTDIYLGFDITLKANSAALTPADADLMGSTLASATVSVKCIGGHLDSPGGVCPATDTSDTIHLGASQGTVITTAGLLFRAIWNITGTNTAGVPIAVHFQTGCGIPTAPTSIAPGVNSVCITMINGSFTPTPETFRTSSFDNSAGATTPFVTVTAPIVNFGTRFVGDTTVSEMLIYTSNNFFSDTVSLSATARSFANDVSSSNPTCSPSLSPTSVNPLGATATAILTITATAAGSCGVTAYGSYSLGALEGFANSTFLAAPITVQVNFVDFSLSASPTLVKFLTTGSATSAITVASLNSFAGNVALSSTSTLNTTAPFLGAAFSPNPVVVQAGGSTASTTTFSGGVEGITYSVTLRGSATISGFTRTKSITLTVVEQDFSMMATGFNPSTFNSGGGNFTTFTVSSKPATGNGLTGTVSLTYIANATGLTVSAPASVTLTAGATTLAQRVNFTSSTPGGYKVTITGSVMASGATVTHSATVFVNVGDFSISASPATTNFNTGAAGTSTTLTFTSLFSFAGTLNIVSMTSPATGLTVTCPASIALPPSPATANCTFSSATGGTYIVTITGNAITGTASHTATVTVAVNDFRVSASPITLTILAGASGTSTITVSSLGVFYQAVYLTASTSPNGLTCTPTPASLTPPAAGAATSSLSCSGPSGSYTVTVTGTSTGFASQTSMVSYAVQDFAVVASPTSISVNTGSSGTSTVTVSAVNGFTGLVTLAVSAPSGVTASVSPNSVAGSGGSTLTVSSSTAGTFNVNVTGSSGSLSHSVTVIVTVTSSANVFGLPATEFYSIIGVVVVIVAVLSAALFFRRRRAKPSLLGSGKLPS